MNETAPDNFSLLLDGLRDRYLKALPPTRALLDGYRQKAETGSLTAAERDEIGAIAHKLAGNGATYGFRAISEKAAELKKLRADTHLDDAEIAVRLGALVAACDTAAFEETGASPGHAATVSVDRNPLPQTLPATGPQPLILIVDDDPATRDMLTAIAGQLARTKTAADGQTALHEMRGERPDLVLLDDRMPGTISGMRLQETMRDDSALCFIPVIFVTASNDTGAVVRGLTGGAVDYVAKPFDADIVAQKIGRHLRKIGTDVLIVEDDISVASLLEHRFIANGFVPRVAGRGHEAMDALAHRTPDLVVLDRTLPDAEGAEILDRMRQTPELANVPVAFLTARDADDDIRGGYARGADEYIVKPFDADDVVNRCARLLASANLAAA